jgi:cytochrome c
LHGRRWAVLGVCGIAGFAALVLSSGVQAAQSDPAPAPNTVEFYNQQVKPIFEANCYKCHGGMNHRGALHLDTQAGLMKGGHDGVVVVPGHPEQSLLVKLIRHEGPANDPMPMPPKGKLSDADIATVTRWIQAGAVMPPDAAQ